MFRLISSSITRNDADILINLFLVSTGFETYPIATLQLSWYDETAFVYGDALVLALFVLNMIIVIINSG